MKLKVFELNYYLDNSGDMFPPHAIVDFPNTVLITKNFGLRMSDVMGTATLTREGDDFYIENLAISDNYTDVIKKLTPAISGCYIEKEGNAVVHFAIKEISFTFGENSNPNIKSVQEQLDEKNNRN